MRPTRGLGVNSRLHPCRHRRSRTPFCRPTGSALVIGLISWFVFLYIVSPTHHIIRTSNLSNQRRIIAQALFRILAEKAQFILHHLPNRRVSNLYSLKHSPVLSPDQAQRIGIEPIPVFSHQCQTVVKVWTRTCALFEYIF